MNDIKEIREKTIQYIEKLKNSYKVDADNNYEIELKERITSIQNKIQSSMTTSNEKETFVWLLEALQEIEYLLKLKQEFNDKENIEQLQFESDIISIRFAFLYTEYSLKNIDKENLVEYAREFSNSLNIIAGILPYTANVFYTIESSELKRIIQYFEDKINEGRAIETKILKSNFKYSIKNDLRLRTIESFKAIYSCLFIIKEIKQERAELKRQEEFESQKKKIYELIYSDEDQNVEEEEFMSNLINIIDENRYRKFIQE